MTNREPDVSIVIPVYNEAGILTDTVEQTLETLNVFLAPEAYELIIAENGSTDETPAIAEELSETHPQVRVTVRKEAGRGGALNEAFRQALGDTVAYFDADLATDMRHLETLINSVHVEGYDVATGSRYLLDSDISRPAKRMIPSKGFNFMTRAFLGSSIKDHQCGFKAFDREALLEIIPDVEDDHWFWDTEVLVRAQRRGFSIHEFPVEWEAKKDSKVDLVEDIIGMGKQVFGRWWEFSVAPRITHKRTVLLGSLLLLLVVALSPYYLETDVLVDHLMTINPMFVLLACGIYLLSLPVRGLRYVVILNALNERISLVLSTGSIFISQTANFVVPARAGDAVRAYIIKTKRGVSYPSGFASVFVERVFDLLTIVGLSIVAGGALWMLDASVYDRLQSTLTTGPAASSVGVYVGALVASAVVVVSLVIVYTARQEKSYVSPLRDRLQPHPYLDTVAKHLQRFGADVQQLADSPQASATALGLSLIVWGIDIATAVIVIQAFDVVLTGTLLAVMVVAVSVGNLSKVLPLTPGGIGLYEGVFTAFVIAVTPLSVELALGAALVDHAIKNGVTTAGGFVAVLAFNISLSETIEQSKQRDETINSTSRERP